MKQANYKILIVDDEEDLCEILEFNLEGEGFETDIAYSAEEALKKDLRKFDLFLLDVMMGEKSGYQLAKIIRKEHGLNTPIIFITAKTAQDDLLTGFNLGGDDYITKPFSVKEIIVRVKAVLKRVPNSDNSGKTSIVVDELKLSFKKRKLFIREKEVDLTKKEFEILALLLHSEGMVISREEILNRVWEDQTIVNDRTVDVHITRLRKKLGAYGKYLRNKSGYGYAFEKIGI